MKRYLKVAAYILVPILMVLGTYLVISHFSKPKTQKIIEPVLAGQGEETMEMAIITASTSIGVGPSIRANLYENIICSVGFTAPSTTMTVKFLGGISDTAPDFSATSSATNFWQYIDMTDVSTNSSIDGLTGTGITASYDYRLLKVTNANLSWFAPVITDYLGGTTTIKCRLSNYN